MSDPMTVAPSSVAVSVKRVSKRYTLYSSAASQLLNILGAYRWLWKRTFPEHIALKDIDFEIKKGERVGIIGRNGSGKTTLLKLITQSTQPSSGEISVEGNVQALMQVGLGFHPEFTGRQNIKASLLYTGLSHFEKEAAESEIINFCELGEYIDLPLKTYSLGMQSRLQFACATSIKPEILVVDEILGAGDAYFSIKSSQRMERLANSGCTLILVSHSMAQVLQFCERVIWLQDGQIYRDGNARSVIGEYEAYMSFEAAKLGANEDLIGFARRAADVLGVDEFGEATQNNDGYKSDDTYKLVTFENDDKGFRWNSENGPKLQSLQIIAESKNTRKFREGSDIILRGEVDATTIQPKGVSVIFTISIFNSNNVRLTRLSSDPIIIEFPRQIRFSLKLSPLRLLAGRYHINFGIFEVKQHNLLGRRFDLVTKFCDFEVISILRYSEDGIFTHDSEWELE